MDAKCRAPQGSQCIARLAVISAYGNPPPPPIPGPGPAPPLYSLMVNIPAFSIPCIAPRYLSSRSNVASQPLASMDGGLQELHAGKAPQAQAAAAKAQIAAKYAGLPLATVGDDAVTSASLHLGDEDRIGGGRDGNAIAK